MPAIDRDQELDFEVFFETEYERLLRSAYLLCRDRAEAEDLAQEAMVRVLERWDRVRAAGSPTAYLYRVALNLHRSAWRRALVAVRNRQPDALPPSEPEATVVRRQQIESLLRSLPATQREALLLVEWVGLTAEEAGRVLGIEPESVRGRLHRARLALRERFGGIDD